MKSEEKIKAIELRRKGASMNEIAQVLGAAKSSVSYWVRDIKLTQKQQQGLSKRGRSIASVEKRRMARIQNTQNKRDAIMRLAQQEAPTLLRDSLWCAGVALYWGEGGKTQHTVRIANSDPAVIEVMMKFFKKFSHISFDKYHGHIHTFSDANIKMSVSYWSKVSGIPRDKFYRTYVKQSVASKNKRQTLPYGTFQIYIHSTEFFFRMMGWLEGYKKHLLQ